MADPTVQNGRVILKTSFEIRRVVLPGLPLTNHHIPPNSDVRPPPVFCTHDLRKTLRFFSQYRRIFASSQPSPPQLPTFISSSQRWGSTNENRKPKMRPFTLCSHYVHALLRSSTLFFIGGGRGYPSPSLPSRSSVENLLFPNLNPVFVFLRTFIRPQFAARISQNGRQTCGGHGKPGFHRFPTIANHRKKFGQNRKSHYSRSNHENTIMRSCFHPTRKEIWRQVRAEIGARYEAGRVRARRRSALPFLRGRRTEDARGTGRKMKSPVSYL
jgi:hypothetical protein